MLYSLDILNGIKDRMVKNKETVAVAESVTAGHLQAAFSAATEASMFFQGGITAYNAGQKCRHLNIEPIYALQDNSVSEQVARQMARGANSLFISSYGIGITGYAATVPEIGVNDLFAFFAIAYGNEILQLKRISSDKTDSVAVQIDYANQVIEAFDKIIEKHVA